MCLDMQLMGVEPFVVYDVDQETGEVKQRKQISRQEVACGKCVECKRQVVNSWVFRLEQEARIADTAFFVTLTYNEDFVPRMPNGDLTLRYDDFKAFMKRLRKRHSKYYSENQSPRFFCVGEYGTTTYRPHFHAIIFNATVENIVKSWSKWFQDEEILRPLGFVHIGKFSMASARYTMNYLQKPMYEKIRIESGAEWKTNKWGQRKLVGGTWTGCKEMRKMSQGLGKAFLSDKQTVKYYSDVENQTVVLSNGQNIRIPRYYRDRLYDDEMKEQSRRKMFMDGQKRIKTEVEGFGTIKVADTLTKKRKGNAKKAQHYLSNIKRDAI